MSKEQDKKAIHVVKKHDDTIEVAIRKNPAKTGFGKAVAILVILGFLVLPVVTAIWAIFSN